MPFIVVPFIARMHPTTVGVAFGALFVALGEAIRLWGVAAAGAETRRRSRKVERLVMHGPFAWLRNPLYFGNLFIWTGFTAIAGLNWFIPIACVVFMIEYTPIVRYEEAVLESTFGDEYQRYKRRTPRWIPVAPERVSNGNLCWKTAWRSERSTLTQYAVLSLVLAVRSLTQ